MGELSLSLELLRFSIFIFQLDYKIKNYGKLSPEKSSPEWGLGGEQITHDKSPKNKIMQRFLKRIALFSSIIIVLAVVIHSINQRLFENDKVILGKDVETLICGSSISARGLDPAIIENSFNVSRAGRTTLDVFKIMEKVLPDNPQIKHITADFSPQGFSRRMEYFYYIPGFMQNRMKWMYPLLNYSDLEGYHVNNKIYLKNFLRYECVPNAYYTKKSLGLTDELQPYLGKFNEDRSYYIEDEDPDKITKELFLFEEEDGWMNRNGVDNLEACVLLTEKLGVDLWLFSGPLHKELRERIPQKFYDAFKVAVDSALTYEHVHFLDYIDYPLPDSCFRNLNHINYYGAQVVSPLVNEEINKAK